MLEHALRIASKGWPVFPCVPRDKKPLTDRGFHDASTDRNTVEAWWRKNPDANIGISTGPAGLVVIDIDEKNGGFDSFAELCKEHGPLDSVTVLTGGGGEHVFFKAMPGVEVRSRSNAFGPNFPGIDVRSTGGYVIAAGSIHPNGRTYTPEASNPPTMATLPQWAARLLAGPDRTPIRGVDNDEKINQGGRHAELMRLAGRLRRLNTSQAIILDVLAAVNRSKCEPPLSDKDVARIAESAAKYPPVEHLQPASAIQKREVPPVAPVVAHVTDWETTKLERIAWLMVNRLPCAEVTIIEGPGGVGKTTMAIDLMARKSTGRAMPDGTPGGEPGNVILIADEDRASILKARLVAAGADLSRIHHIVSFGTPGDRGNRFSMPKHARALHDTIVEFGAELVIIDALFSHFDEGLKSGVTEDVRRVIGPLSEIAHSTKCVITATRHWGKTARGASQRGLGSVDITNVARSVLTVAEDPEEPTRTVVAVAKGNLGIKYSLVPSLTFTLQSVTISEGLVSVEIARVVWGNQVNITADDLANAVPPSAEDTSKAGACADMIRELLAGGPKGAGEIEKALLAADFKRAMIFRAKKKAGIKTIDSGGFPRRTTWSLPSSSSQQYHARDHKKDDTTYTTETAGQSYQSSQSSQSSQSYSVSNGDTSGDTSAKRVGKPVSGLCVNGHLGMVNADRICTQCLDSGAHPRDSDIIAEKSTRNGGAA